MRLALGKPLNRLVVLVCAAGVAALALILIQTSDWNSAFDKTEFWVFAVCLFLAELFPIRLPGRDYSMTVSWTFTFALLLTFGPAPAIVIQILASIVSDAIGRKPAVRWAYNAAGYVLAFGAAYSVLEWSTGVPRSGVVHFVASDIPGILAAAGAVLLVNAILTGAALALAEGTTFPGYLGSLRGALPGLRDTARRMSRDGFGIEAADLGALLLAPIVVVTADVDIWLLPILGVILLGLYRGGRAALLNEYRALHDALTDLPNRTLFDQRAVEAIAEARESGGSVAAMLIDLDRFKDVNNTLGHSHGDLLLREVGARLGPALHEGDTIARLGGDEFAVVLPGSGPEQVASAAGDVRLALQAPFEIEGVTIEIGASIGIACFPDHGATPDLLLQRADIALYQAKDARSGFEIYSPERDDHSRGRLALAGELRSALGRDELVVFFQPKADIRTGHISGAEALVRWAHPRRGLLGPEKFIAIAEHTGMIRPLAERVLETALVQCQAWRQIGHELVVSVNVSAGNLLDPSLVQTVADLLRVTGAPARLLELELTETTIMSDPERALAVLRELRALGIGLSVDDFGTGYSSLAYLRELPVTELKIDRSFIQGMTEDSPNATIVRSTIDLGRNLGLEVVAEGVESAHIWDQLLALGCGLAQGYFLSEPVPADRLTRWLRDRPPALAPTGRFSRT
jgi:diguanylate cyclase (GGDEF)-like protein